LLVREILKLNAPSPRILDVGTGSGCIPITLKLEIPNSTIITIDISDKALSVAKENARLLNANVEFIQINFLEDFSLDPVDIIVSNPPYVCESEKQKMLKNVLDYEPHLALFVPNNNPLLFYDAIAAKSGFLLKPHGKVFVEINEHFGVDVKMLFEKSGFVDVQIIKDLDGKDRVVSATKKD
jgi:release factor glutamine methyltransferase